VLVLTIPHGQTLQIGEARIRVEKARGEAHAVKLYIDAPQDIRIDRKAAAPLPRRAAA
jgi:sRNA-binding carbon storage regulator CsrA